MHILGEKDTYSCFGKLVDPNEPLIRSLESQGIQRLYSISSNGTINMNNHKKELKKLNHSILIAYLDLLEVLVKAPNTQLPLDQQQIDINNEQQLFKTLRDQKLEDIELLFINMHHLINELRPMQARDNIRCILELQKRQRLEIALKFKTHLFKIVDLLKVCIESIQQNDKNAKTSIFLEELKTLMASANQLTHTLEKIEQTTANAKNVNIESKQVEMMECEDGEEKSLFSCSDIVLKTKRTPNSAGQPHQRDPQANKYCDFKDLILCDLIDDFLLQENEF